MLTPMDKAQALIRSITEAIALGCQHSNKAGVLLTTPKEVLKCMIDEGAVNVFDPRAGERFLVDQRQASVTRLPEESQEPS